MDELSTFLQKAMPLLERLEQWLPCRPAHPTEATRPIAGDQRMMLAAGCNRSQNPTGYHWFLDRRATHILPFKGDSSMVWHEGYFANYEEDKKRRLGEDA